MCLKRSICSSVNFTFDKPFVWVMIHCLIISADGFDLSGSWQTSFYHFRSPSDSISIIDCAFGYVTGTAIAVLNGIAPVSIIGCRFEFCTNTVNRWNWAGGASCGALYLEETNSTFAFCCGYKCWASNADHFMAMHGGAHNSSDVSVYLCYSNTRSQDVVGFRGQSFNVRRINLSSNSGTIDGAGFESWKAQTMQMLHSSVVRCSGMGIVSISVSSGLINNFEMLNFVNKTCSSGIFRMNAGNAEFVNCAFVNNVGTYFVSDGGSQWSATLIACMSDTKVTGTYYSLINHTVSNSQRTHTFDSKQETALCFELTREFTSEWKPAGNRTRTALVFAYQLGLVV